MADIAMCKHKECPYTKSCWRFQAPVNPYRQSYLDGKTACEDKGYKMRIFIKEEE